MTRLFILTIAVSVMAAAFCPAAGADENPNAEDNLALYEEALRLQGYLAPQLNLQDFGGGSEAFYERQGVNPEFISGDWILYSPDGRAHFWDSYGKFTSVNNFRVKAGTSALASRNARMDFWKMRHSGMADARGGGYTLHETDRFRFGLEMRQILDTGFSASYRRHDVDRNAPHAVLPGYHSDNLRFEYMGRQLMGVEWNAGFTYAEFTSEDLGFKNSAEKSLWISATKPLSPAVRLSALAGKDWHDTAGGVIGSNFGFSRERFKLGARVDSPECPWFAGADFDMYSNGRTPIYGSHITRGEKLTAFLGYRGFYFVDRIRLGFERSNMNSFRLMYERPEFDRLLIGGQTASADDLGIIQIERPTYDKWFADGRFTLGPARLTANYSTSAIERTATWRPGADAYPVRTYWPEDVDAFSAMLYLPVTQAVALNFYDVYRKQANGSRGTSRTEAMLGGDVSLGITEHHSLTFGYETSDFKSGAAAGAAYGGTIGQDTWRIGLSGDFDAWDFRLGYLNASASSTEYAADWGSWNSLDAEVTMRRFGFPLTLGCEFFDGGYDFAPALDADGFRLWARMTVEF